MKKASVIKNIRKIHGGKSLLPALSFTDYSPRSGDMVAIHMAVSACAPIPHAAKTSTGASTIAVDPPACRPTWSGIA